MTAKQAEQLQSIYDIVSEQGSEFHNLYTKEYLTQEDMIYILENQMFYNIFLGSEVELNNSVGATNRWIIIGMNHDGTENTFDLLAKHSMKDGIAYGSNQYWANTGCTIRTWLNGEFLAGFDSEIAAHITTMDVRTNNAVTQDKVKLLSVAELGVTHDYATVGEGTKYEHICPHVKYNSSKTANCWYWLRSRSTCNSSYAWCVDTYGNVDVGSTISNAGGSAVPVIRLS